MFMNHQKFLYLLPILIYISNELPKTSQIQFSPVVSMRLLRFEFRGGQLTSERK